MIGRKRLPQSHQDWNKRWSAPFGDAPTGLSVTQISSLFVLWSLTTVLLTVPAGSLADIVPRRDHAAAQRLVAALAPVDDLLHRAGRVREQVRGRLTGG